ncbi:MAG: ABC transporter permease [Bifidobacteriaceae bacterium]|nr:ABC transporter permease [Bifidobacteriaceae bacterium]MCI1914565.1 ABC transporter permease [Bifidobacteriaceae bacterium]
MPHSSHPPRRIVRGLLPWASVALLLAVWFIATNARTTPGFFPSPQQVGASALDLNSEGLLWPSLGASLARVGTGLALGIVVAVPTGILAGSSRLGYIFLDKPAHMLRAIPFNALSPLLIIAVGIGEGMKITLIAVGVFGPLYVNLRDGVRNVDPKLLEFARAYHLNRRTIFAQILLRGTLPSFMTGLRFGLTVAWIALVTCETVNSQNGIGYILARSQQFSRTDQMVLCIVAYAVLGLASEGLVGLLERATLPWKRSN